MKSNIVKLTEGSAFDRDILREVEKCTTYNGLSAKETLRVTLLAEELIGMLPNLVAGYTASFWIENSDKEYEMHAVLEAPRMSLDDRDRILAVSSTGKNAAAVGIIGRIRTAIDVMRASADFPETELIHYNFLDAGITPGPGAYSYLWTLESFKESAAEKTEKWDELEKSVIAKMADNVTVGIKGSKIEIIVTKTL